MRKRIGNLSASWPFLWLCSSFACTSGVSAAIRQASFARVFLVGTLLVATGPQAVAGGDPAPEKARQPRTDLLGDALPPHAMARFGSVRFRTPAQVRSIAYSPD